MKANISSEKPDHRVLIDTNVFIQLRDLKDLPWRSLFKGNWIELIVAPVVIEELDKFKVDREGRRRDRSRAALQLIREASSKPDMRLELKTEHPYLTLKLADGGRFDWSMHPGLDSTRADDHLIAAAISARAMGVVSILSHDTGPVIRARLNGISAHDAPDAWLLPNPPTAENQEAAKLKRDLDAARATRPNLALTFPQRNQSSRDLEIRIPTLPPLPQPVLTRLIDLTLERNPKEHLRADQDDFAFTVLSYGRGLSSYDVEKYRSEYDKFTSDVSTHFAKLHETIASASMAFPMKYVIENASQVTANNLIVEIESPHDAVIFADRKDAEWLVGRVRPPKPPKRPKTDLERSSELMRLQTRGFEQEPRDPTSFYWQTRPDGSGQEASLICAEFRAGRTWLDEAVIYPRSDFPYEGIVGVKVGATNSPITTQETVRVCVAATNAIWTDEDVLDLLPEWMSEAIRG